MGNDGRPAPGAQYCGRSTWRAAAPPFTASVEAQNEVSHASSLESQYQGVRCSYKANIKGKMKS